jgi:hypothetical protein
MNIITQEAKKCQAVVKLANRKGKSHASRMYGVSLSSVNTRSFSGMVYAAKHIGICGKNVPQMPRKHDRRYQDQGSDRCKKHFPSRYKQFRRTTEQSSPTNT